MFVRRFERVEWSFLIKFFSISNGNKIIRLFFFRNFYFEIIYYFLLFRNNSVQLETNFELIVIKSVISKFTNYQQIKLFFINNIYCQRNLPKIIFFFKYFIEFFDCFQESIQKRNKQILTIPNSTNYLYLFNEKFQPTEPLAVEIENENGFGFHQIFS